MLNYVWLGLLIVGIGVAITTDIIEQSDNKYRNNEPFPVEIQFDEPFDPEVNRSYDAELVIDNEAYNRFYGVNISAPFFQPAKITVSANKEKTQLYFQTDDNTPVFWKDMASVSGNEDDLTGTVEINEMSDSVSALGTITLEPISFAKMRSVTNSALEYAGIAVEIALGLIGIMALWLGVMKVAEEAGLIRIIARAVRPITKFLFPDVPSDHPAMGSMIMNISANMLGLGNAATPFGLKAMEELDKLNPEKGTATNAMVTFLAINTAGLTLIPATAIAIRAASGSSNPAIIIGTSIFGALCASVVGITAAKVFEKFPIQKGEFGSWLSSNAKGLAIFGFIIVALGVLIVTGGISIFSTLFSFIDPEFFRSVIQIISVLAIPVLIFTFITYGAIKKVKVYETFVDGAKEGFDIAVRIIPYLVAMLMAIGIFRGGGTMEYLVMLFRPITDFIGMPAEALPMAMMRPLSGSGSLGIMSEILAVHGPDSYIGILVSTFFGSTETTFYVLAVYFGAVNIRKTRHALAAGLLADIAGILAAVFIVNMLFK